MNSKKLTGILLIVALVLISCISLAISTDTYSGDTGPETFYYETIESENSEALTIDSLTVSKTTFMAPDSVTLSVDLSNVVGVMSYFGYRIQGSAEIYFGGAFQYNNDSKLWELTIVFPEYIYPGSYDIWFDIFDNAGNSVSTGFENIFTVFTEHPDIIAPTWGNFHMDRNINNTNEKAAFSLSVEDDLSGVFNVAIVATDPIYEVGCEFSARYDNQSGLWKCTVNPEELFSTSIYSIGIPILDNAGNLAWYEDAQELVITVISGDYTYTLNADENAIITGYTGKETSIEIPGTIDDYPVVGIYDETFSNNVSLVSVNIPDTIQSIGDSAFHGCTSLISAILPEELNDIGDAAFADCPLLTITLLKGSYSHQYAEENGITFFIDEPVYVSNYEELKALSNSSVTEIVITADITYPEEAGTIKFDHGVTIRSAEGEHYVIDGNGHQIILIDSGMINIDEPYQWVSIDSETIVMDLTFTGGYAEYIDNQPHTNTGGAICVMGSLELINCVFYGNEASGCDSYGGLGNGGAVYTRQLTATNCLFNNNKASYGGGISVHDATLINCIISENIADRSGGGFGIGGSATFTDCIISNNKALGGTGGGIHCVGRDGVGSLLIAGDTNIFGNSATEDGRGISCNSLMVTIAGGSIYDNSAQHGGGISYVTFYPTTLIIDGSSITGNTAEEGGGIYAGTGEVQVISGSILDNFASKSGENIFSSKAYIIIDGGKIRCDIDELYPTGITTQQGRIIYHVSRESLVSIDETP